MYVDGFRSDTFIQINIPSKDKSCEPSIQIKVSKSQKQFYGVKTNEKRNEIKQNKTKSDLKSLIFCVFVCFLEELRTP